jgi:hypothetical protein
MLTEPLTDRPNVALTEQISLAVVTMAGRGVVLEALQNAQGRRLLDCADFFRGVRLKADFLHAAIIRP